MTINLQSLSSLDILVYIKLKFQKDEWLSNERKNSSLKALPWLELAVGYLNLVTKHL